MPTNTLVRLRRWRAALIVTLFFAAVAGSAAVGWWYARESPAHQGPILLISVDGVPAAALPAYGAQRTDTPAIDRLAADAVVFDRAYTHSPELLPAHASMLSGQLPLEHGVRDNAGFALGRDVLTLAEMLRSRGFNTGAAVSSFLLRPESGVAQGFAFFDAEIPPGGADAAPALGRDGARTIDAAERWVQTQNGQRFFLFVQIDEEDADAAVTRLAGMLKARGLYADATIVLVGDRGGTRPAATLDEAALHVPLLVKQPGGDGAGRRVAGPVQHIDLVPTILDLVRAPVPGDLRGRSLRAVLDDEGAAVGEQPVYSESLAARHRFGGDPIFALTSADYRYIRGRDETLIALRPPEPGVGGGESAAMGRLRAELDRLIAEAAAEPPQPIAAEDEERYALFGYLAMPRIAPLAGTTLDAAQQLAVADAHYAAAVLIGQKRYSAGIRALQAILLSHPALTVVHYQVGTVLARTGRLEEAIGAFRAARELRPEEAALALALADALMRAGQIEAAGEQALDAVALAPDGDARQQAAAHEMAARVALARQDAEAATRHAEAAYDADPAVPVPAFVRGRLRYEQSEYEEAAAAFEDAVAALQERGGAPVPDLHLYLGETLTHLGRYAEAEAEYREELRAFPRNMRAYAGLATLYHASNRDDSVEDVLNELVSATPTPEVYEVAARLWTMFGDRSRAEALRSDGETRFRGDPSLALLGRDVRR